MKTILSMVCMISAMWAVVAAQKPSLKKTSLSETELRTLAQTVPDVKNGGKLYSVAIATTDNLDRQQEYLKAAAACLIACGKNDVYRKYVKGKLLNVTAFENELKDECKQCSGAGTNKRRCYVCMGKGQCSSCKGTGRISTMATHSFNKVWKPCGKCNENGRCNKCGGEGSTKEKCFACAGTGKVFSKTVAARVFRDSCNAIADGIGMMASQNKAADSLGVNVKSEVVVKPEVTTEKQANVAKSSTTRRRIRETGERNIEEQNVDRETSKVKEAKVSKDQKDRTKGGADEWSELDYGYFEDGCYSYNATGTFGFIYVENSSGGANYVFEGSVNIKPQAQFPDGRGGVRGDYYVADKVFLVFPTSEARRLWASAMRSGCQKMLEWLNTAKENNVGHVEKVLPESTFKDGYAYATVALVPFGARQQELGYKAIRKDVAEAEFSKIARRVEFKCVIDSVKNNKFNVRLLVGCGGEFPFVFYSSYFKNVAEISSSVQKDLQKADPDSLAKAWRSQVARNSMFHDDITDDDERGRLVALKKDNGAANKRADSSREIYDDFCLSSWNCDNSSHEGGRICLAIKDTEGDWNYTLFLGENGFAQRQVYEYGMFYGRDFIFDRHLVVFPTEESRNHWYDVVERSLGKMLEWVEIAAKKRVPVIAKPIYITRKGAPDMLMAYHNLITKGHGQDELLKKELRTHISQMDYAANGCPVSLICNMRKKGEDYTKFKVNIELVCGDKYRGVIFETFGTYEKIQNDCIGFLRKIDPKALITAWKDKYGRGDLFK